MFVNRVSLGTRWVNIGSRSTMLREHTAVGAEARNIVYLVGNLTHGILTLGELLIHQLRLMDGA